MIAMPLDDPRFAAAGVRVEPINDREADVFEGEGEGPALTRVSIRDGQLNFFPDRVSSQKRLLTRLAQV